MAMQRADGNRRGGQNHLPYIEREFHQFHYLTFLPTAEEVYDCQVEHWGLDEPLLKHWGTEPSLTTLTPPLFPGPVVSSHHQTFLIPWLMSLYPNFTISGFLLHNASTLEASACSLHLLTPSFLCVLEAQEPVQVPETMETVVCVLGLLVGLAGIIAGAIILKNR